MKEEKKVLGKDIRKLMFAVCRPYFSTEEDLLKNFEDLVSLEKEYTIEEIKEITIKMTTDKEGNRKSKVRKYKTSDEISQEWKGQRIRPKDSNYR